MGNFALHRGINLQKIPPVHPSSNPAETFMRPLGKAMKIGRNNNVSEKTTLDNLLSDYRDTPHPATGISPATMMFRDGKTGAFPRVTMKDQDIQQARKRDQNLKMERQEKINSGKYVKRSIFQEGDAVYIRNYQKSHKFDPIFAPKILKVFRSSPGKIAVVDDNGQEFIRHPDDVRLAMQGKKVELSNNIEDYAKSLLKTPVDDYNEDSEIIDIHGSEQAPLDDQEDAVVLNDLPAHVPDEQPLPRRSSREQTLNRMYHNYWTHVYHMF